MEKQEAKQTIWQGITFAVRHPFLSISFFLDRKIDKLFPTKPESEKIKEMLDAAQLEIEQTRKVVRDHLFTQHMARAKIEALQAWHKQEELLCDPGVPPLQGSDNQ